METGSEFGELENLGPSDMSSNKSFLRLLVVLAVTTEVIKAFPGVGFPGAGFSKPPNKNGKFSKLRQRNYDELMCLLHIAI